MNGCPWCGRTTTSSLDNDYDVRVERETVFVPYICHTCSCRYTEQFTYDITDVTVEGDPFHEGDREE